MGRVYNLRVNYYIPNNNDVKEGGIDLDDNDSGFSAVDIELPIKELNVAEITLTKRYPSQGFAKNTKSTMVVKVLEGEVLFVSEDENILLPKGSVLLVETNKKYAWEPQSSVVLYIISTPPWTPDQVETIDD